MLILDVQVLHLITFKLFIGVLQSFNELKYLIWVYMLFQNLLVLSELTLLAKTKNSNNSNIKKDKLCKNQTVHDSCSGEAGYVLATGPENSHMGLETPLIKSG